MTEQMQRELLTKMNEIQGEVDSLSRALERFIKSTDKFEEDRDKYESRLREWDQANDKRVLELLEDLIQRVEGIGKAHRDLPDKLLHHVERTIYSLRIARYEALQAGVANEPAPLPPPPLIREATGKFKIVAEETDRNRPESIEVTATGVKISTRLVESVGRNLPWLALGFLLTVALLIIILWASGERVQMVKDHAPAPTADRKPEPSLHAPELRPPAPP